MALMYILVRFHRIESSFLVKWERDEETPNALAIGRFIIGRPNEAPILTPRTMFLVTVLIGQTLLSNPSIKKWLLGILF